MRLFLFSLQFQNENTNYHLNKEKTLFNLARMFKNYIEGNFFKAFSLSSLKPKKKIQKKTHEKKNDCNKERNENIYMKSIRKKTKEEKKRGKMFR